MQTFEQSTFQKRPAYRYIRGTDHLPATEEARSQEDPVAKVKIFNPCGSWTWYIAGYDPETHIAWGLVDGFEKEIGDFDMTELVAVRTKFGLPL